MQCGGDGDGGGDRLRRGVAGFDGFGGVLFSLGDEGGAAS